MIIGHGARPWAAYPALSAPLTMMGVERRWFLLSATVGMAMWNAINSIVLGAVTFCILYAWAGGPGAPTRTCSLSCANPSDSKRAMTRRSGPRSRGISSSPRLDG